MSSRRVTRVSPRSVTAAALLGLLSLACPGVHTPLERPRASLHAVSLPDVTGPAQGRALDVQLALDVTNPNHVPIEVRVLDWTVTVAGAPRFRGRTELGRMITGGGSARIDARAALPPAIADAVRARVAAGARDYHVRATLHVFSARGAVAVVFDERGSVR